MGEWSGVGWSEWVGEWVSEVSGRVSVQLPHVRRAIVAPHDDVVVCTSPPDLLDRRAAPANPEFESATQGIRDDRNDEMQNVPPGV